MWHLFTFLEGERKEEKVISKDQISKKPDCSPSPSSRKKILIHFP